MTEVERRGDMKLVEGADCDLNRQDQIKTVPPGDAASCRSPDGTVLNLRWLEIF